MVIRDAKLDISVSIPCAREGSRESVDLSCLLCADDIVSLADDDSILQRNLDKLLPALARFGMEVSLPKTICMTLSEGLGDSNLRVKIDGSDIGEVDKFVYLGSLLPISGKIVDGTYDGRTL
ncbi:hypothetical protein FOZ60_012215 [Perkinsus olseni]|uniref:Reverse transcriptase domain-containing protein n=1 Tax=Perkinsus olseni TaxID=32597 RepID=A0A7J6NBW2_PEROL|nr:hypothetical protein FOZ60_012215 [Perkinsus olseni]